ncbi:hypothetical protein HK099_002550, partial [Clydaea vesicula]
NSINENLSLQSEYDGEKRIDFSNSKPKDKDDLDQFKDLQNLFCSEFFPLPETSFRKVELNFNNFVKKGEKPLINQGSMFVIPLNDIVSNGIISGKSWEYTETLQMLAIMSRAASNGVNTPYFLDIGSNVGWFSTVMAALGYNVIAFDAMKSNALLFRSTLCENPKMMEKVTFINKG